nr:MAG TPA: hypothetical protein [Caudoviricetes sp.]
MKEAHMFGMCAFSMGRRQQNLNSNEVFMAH